MKKSELVNLIREEIKKTNPGTDPDKKKMSSGVKTISKDLKDQESSFNTIQTKDKMVELLDLMVNKLDPEFKSKPAFKQAIKVFYAKHK